MSNPFLDDFMRLVLSLISIIETISIFFRNLVACTAVFIVPPSLRSRLRQCRITLIFTILSRVWVFVVPSLYPSALVTLVTI